MGIPPAFHNVFRDQIRNSDNVVATLQGQAPGHSPEVTAVDEAEVNRLCEELSALIEIKPGLNLDALGRAHGAIAALQSTQSGDYADNKLIALAFGFEQWFSSDKCARQGARGQIVKECLERDLISLQAAMWRKSNDQTKRTRIVELAPSASPAATASRQALA